MNIVALEIGGHALEPADRHRLRGAAVALLDASATARRFARAVAGAPEDPGEDVALAIQEIGFGVAALRDEADVLGDVGVGRAGPLAIHDLVEVVGLADVRGLHAPPLDAGAAASMITGYRSNNGLGGESAVTYLPASDSRVYSETATPNEGRKTGSGIAGWRRRLSAR